MRPVKIIEQDNNKINELVENNTNLVYYVLNNYLNLSDVEKQDIQTDLFQAGCIGLWKAAQRWDKNLSEFHTYAIPAIKNYALLYLKNFYNTKNFVLESLENTFENDYSSYEKISVQDDIDFFDDSAFINCLTPKELDLYKWLINGGTVGEYAEMHKEVSFQSIYNRSAWIRKKWIDIFGPVQGYQLNGKPIKKVKNKKETGNEKSK